MSEGRLLIARFGPWSAEGCRKNAQGTYEDDVENGHEPARYGVSVFGGHLRVGETRDDLVCRICGCVPVTGRKVAVVWADELEQQGWAVHLNMPPDMHYLVGQGGLAELPDFDALALLWAEHKVNNPALQKG
ncbi:hypothetical protein [Mycobacterium avium]|uniref:hypothetical protein n=1 Tax=Mycobacterium avium TaxID=1764 RepID=UPI001CC506EE|nr:hypothetical protein [Mycobacterium avium]MBZ4618832.1 hypothetical protein [Mycobacterium avium subsp. hominissuis]